MSETSDIALNEAPPPEEIEAVEAAARKSPSLLDAPATYLLLAINIVVFCLMVPGSPLAAAWHGRQFGALLTTQFDSDSLVYFGGSLGPAVIEYNQWWRLVTGAFVHANFLHIAINMWCLWNLGLLGEPLLGKQGLLLTYVLTGVAGNLLSLALHPNQLVVGASGAVFGIAGILIVLLSNRKLSLPWKELRSLRRSVVLFAVLNLLIGMAPQFVLGVLPSSALARTHMDLSMLTRTDNAAHLGGLLCGLGLGFPLFPRMMSGRAGYRARQRVTFVVAALVVLLVAYGIAAAFRAR